MSFIPHTTPVRSTTSTVQISCPGVSDRSRIKTQVLDFIPHTLNEYYSKLWVQQCVRCCGKIQNTFKIQALFEELSSTLCIEEMR
jgi:hypothetical protein